ncbi:MAG TPA: FxsA family protein [Acidimicrobiia bacterium]|nr:FxsA family protein [Acidimicrobiia bacterium]
MLFIVVALLLLPILEIAVMIQVSHWIGGWETIALVLAVSFFGAWMVKQQGTGQWRRIRAELAIGRVPGPAVVDGALLLAAGVLFLVPGFVTDLLAVLLLVPPVRALVREMLARRYRVVAAVHSSGTPTARGDVLDVDSHAHRRDSRPGTHPELGP